MLVEMWFDIFLQTSQNQQDREMKWNALLSFCLFSKRPDDMTRPAQRSVCYVFFLFQCFPFYRHHDHDDHHHAFFLNTETIVVFLAEQTKYYIHKQLIKILNAKQANNKEYGLHVKLLWLHLTWYISYST